MLHPLNGATVYATYRHGIAGNPNKINRGVRGCVISLHPDYVVVKWEDADNTKFKYGDGAYGADISCFGAYPFSTVKPEIVVRSAA